MSARRRLSLETVALSLMGVAFLGVAIALCVTAFRAAESGPVVGPTVAVVSPMLPPALTSSQDSAVVDPQPEAPVFAPAPAPSSIFTQAQNDDFPVAAQPRLAPSKSPSYAPNPIAPSIVLGSSMPMPPLRPIELNPRPVPSPSPLQKPDLAEIGAKPATLGQYDQFTAVYDLSAHTVYLPDGGRLEAHSGLGALKDDPAHVDQQDRGATPPHVYDLTLREDLFHGVQALRLNPQGGSATIFGRAGLLAHTYMLGSGGDSNGCVSFRNYDAFLQAFQSGKVKRLAVVAALK